MKKLLIITYHFPPSSAVAVHRMIGFARHLPKFGWRPIVVAPPTAPGEPQDESLLDQVPENVTVVRTPFPTGFMAKCAGRLVGYSTWLPVAWRAAARTIEEHRPDAVLTSSPPHRVHTLGWFLQKQFRLPWIAEFRDPLYTNFRYESQTALRTHGERWLEQLVLHSADAVVANTPIGCQGLQLAYPQYRDKITTITNGFDPEKFTHRAEDANHSGPLTLLHAGEFYSGRDPRSFLDAVQSLSSGSDLPFRLHFLGRATQGLFDLAKEIDNRGLSPISQIGGQVPYVEALSQMQQSDILLLVASPGYRIGVPAKLYEYLGAGRPILALAEPDGDAAWVLRQSGVLHRVAPPNDAARIQKALSELASEIRDNRSVAPQTNAVHQFTREYLTGEMAKILDACTVQQTGEPKMSPVGVPTLLRGLTPSARRSLLELQ